jgi:hypothetical protein
LTPGYGTTGVAHLVGEHEIRQVVTREASEPTRIEILVDGIQHSALTWTMTSTWSDWSAERLARAACANVRAGGGPFGDARAYLEAVVDALALHGRADPVAAEYQAAWVELVGDRTQLTGPGPDGATE